MTESAAIARISVFPLERISETRPELIAGSLRRHLELGDRHAAADLWTQHVGALKRRLDHRGIPADAAMRALIRYRDEVAAQLPEFMIIETRRQN